MRNRLQITIVLLAGFWLLLAGCYKEEHFTMPGTGESELVKKDSMPDPFTGANRVYLIRNGVPDFTRMSVMSFTDFAVELPYANSSWSQQVDSSGLPYFGCRQHFNFYALNATDHFGDNQLSYMYNQLTSRQFLLNGEGKNWKVSVRMALEVIGHNEQSLFSFEGALGWSKRTRFIFDWTSGSGTNLVMGRGGQQYALNGNSTLSCWKYISPNTPFNFDICCVDNFYYLNINGETIWAYDVNDAKDHAFPLVFRPWMNGARFYDLSIEGDYLEHQPVAVQQESNYASIQAPALAAVGNEVLLFAEGRKENVIQSSRLTSVRSNATDIVLKRSSDGGNTWGNWSLIKGGGVYLRPEIIHAGDRLYLFYTEDLSGKQDGQYRIGYLVSEDGGHEWTEGNAVGAAMEGYNIFTLSGHGLKTTDGNLVLPVQCRIGNKGTVAVIYSADNGNSWTLGNPVDGLRYQSANLTEQAGALVMYIGHSSVGASRKMVTSTDRGINWSEPVDAAMPTGKNGQQGYGATVQGENGVLYHFTPSEVVKTSLFSGSSVSTDPLNGSRDQKILYIYRPATESFGKGLTMTVSRDGGTSWSASENIVGFNSYDEFTFPVGAMDAVITGNTVLLVTESGCAVPYEGLLIFRKSR